MERHELIELPLDGLESPTRGEPHSKSCDQALTRVFQFLGKRWNGVILATLTNGSSGFAELKRSVNGISDSVLSERLNELQGARLVIRSVQPGPPVSVIYSLSDAGAALLPAMTALMEWSRDNLVEVDNSSPSTHAH
jgi:DNA-binding HxlR family transcriptional regulator